MKNLRRYDKNEISAVSKVIKEGKYLSGFTTKFHGGEEVQKFEKEFAKYIGTKYALTFNSGTSALYVAISSIIEYGKKNRKRGNGMPLSCCISTWARIDSHQKKIALFY